MTSYKPSSWKKNFHLVFLVWTLLDDIEHLIAQRITQGEQDIYKFDIIMQAPCCGNMRWSYCTYNGMREGAAPPPPLSFTSYEYGNVGAAADDELLSLTLFFTIIWQV